MSISEAIQYLEACRDTHVGWTDEYIESLPAEARDYVGDRQFHEDCVTNYNLIIQLLGSLC